MEGAPCMTSTSLMPMGMPARAGSGSPLLHEIVDARGLREGAFFGQAQIDIEPRIFLLDASVVAGGKVGSLGAAGRDFVAQRGQGLRLLNVALGGFCVARQSQFL